MTNEVPDPPLLVMFAILAICLIAYMMLHHRFFARIRKYHPAIWDSLGRPSFTDSDPIHVNFQVVRFIMRQGYIPYNDPILNRLGRWILVVSRAFIVVFMSAVLLWIFQSLHKT